MNCFTLNFLDAEITLPKASVQFTNGLGIVQAVYNTDDYYEPLLGIVDE